MKMKRRTQTIPANNITDTNTSSSTTSNNQRPDMLVSYLQFDTDVGGLHADILYSEI